ncbi:hypothetical protein L1987_42065 [Smallanthus sonchifolius]|uniref:Uncharacterized protein n=1 Tax=Smallanthus sonchifolius TaxID=185202 RepID=A0ACB9GVK1_9ASTR|nr:hypothetical protein L1987_42065 [Smallanthus sonchifolius]
MGRRQIGSEPRRWVSLILLLMGLFSCLLAYMYISVIFKPNEDIKFSSVSETDGGCCRGIEGFELWGAVVKWGSDFKLNSSTECCNACKAMCNGKEGPCLCDSWVFCGNLEGCGSRFGECWLKRQKDPLTPDWREAGNNTIWTSGFAFGKGEATVKMETKYGTLHIKVSGNCKIYAIF